MLQRALSIACAIAAFAAPAWAQTKPADVTLQSRVLKSFDFEETKLGNHEEVPMFWQKVVGRGFPLYCTGKFDRAVARSATTSFRLDLDGGSVAYRLTPGKIAINPSADYLVVGFVKTSGLRHARAEMTAWLANDDSKLLTSTETHSNTWALPPGAADDGWHALQLYIPATDAPNARSLVLQVGLMQPQQLLAGPLGKFELYQQDLKGTAWFDDLTVYQLPRVGVATRATANIVAPGATAELTLTVSDLGTDTLEAALLVADATNKTVFRENYPIKVQAGRPWIKPLSCGVLPPGLYTATFDVVDAAHRAPITRRQTQFAVLAPSRQRPPAREFGLVASRWPVEAWDQLPHILQSCGAGLVEIPLWRRDMSEEALTRRDQPFDDLMLALLRSATKTIATFGEVPAVLSAKLPPKNAQEESILALLAADPALWRPYMSLVLARYATRIDYWQVGRQSDTVFANDPRFADAYAKARKEIAALLNAPRVLVPWDARSEFDPKAFPEAILDLRLPATIKPAQIPAYLRNVGNSVMAKLEPLPDSHPRTEVHADFAQRLVYARSANPAAILIDIPMARRTELFTQTSQPSELLLVYRTLVEHLGGTRFVRAFAPTPATHAFLFDRAGVGTLVLWADSPTTASLAVGASPTRVDLYGNTAALTPAKGLTSLQLGTTPVILANVDARLVEVRASFALATGKLPAGAGVLRTTVRLHNPYAQPLSGTLAFQAVKGWSFDPPSVPLAIPPGASLEAPITITYPFNEPAGVKTLCAILKTDTTTLDLSYQAAVTSDIVEMECHAQLLPTGQLVLQQVITNLSQAPLNCQAYAMAPGLPRQQRYVMDLRPGQSTIKRFTFTLPTKPAEYAGKTATLGLRLTDGQTLLTRTVPME